MPNLTLKGIPRDLHERLKEEAGRSRRSLNSEIIHRLESSLSVPVLDAEEFLATAREVRERTRVPFVTEQDLRRARETGRS